jgi:5-methylcytosine-specific restriction endonuclease McrA
MSLRSLSDHEILSQIQELTRRERSLTLAVLLHLGEIERRRLHLKQGYASMFEYCTTGLGYSASAASRRIRTARCVARLPQVYSLLESNEVNLSTVCLVSRILNSDNAETLLGRIRGKSQREVEAIVAEYEPRRALPRESVRAVVVAPPTAVRAPAAKTASAQTPAAKHDRSGCERSDRDSAPAQVTPAQTPAEKRFVIQFCASEAFMAKLEQVRSLAWHRLSAGAPLEQVFELALEYFIEREDPCKRRERRIDRTDRREARKPASMARDSVHRARRIPAPLHDEVFARDRGRCTYVGTGGRRCGSTQALQVDHVTPVARGGTSTPGNLRLLCAFHNRLEAERVLGVAGRGPAQALERATPPPPPGRGSSRATPA